MNPITHTTGVHDVQSLMRDLNKGAREWLSTRVLHQQNRTGPRYTERTCLRLRRSSLREIALYLQYRILSARRMPFVSLFRNKKMASPVSPRISLTKSIGRLHPVLRAKSAPWP